MTNVTESKYATAGGEARRPERHVPGEPGIWVLLFGDLTVFTILFVVYLHQRGLHPGMFAESQAELNRTLGALNTLVLLGSSLLVVFATRARRSELQRSLAPWL